MRRDAANRRTTRALELDASCQGKDHEPCYLERVPMESWLASFDRAALLRTVSRRMIESALASVLVHAKPPALVDDVVYAVVGPGDADNDELARVGLHLEGDRVDADCSRCVHAFGLCVHVAIVAVDLACSRALREALLAGRDSSAAAANAPAVREAVNAEISFERALGVWLSPANAADAAERVEIAATPMADDAAPYGRGYGDKFEPMPRSLSLVVRRAGERKLLAPRDIVPPRAFNAKDRRVLEHVRDRGSGKKAVFASGVDASLTLEAMRAHGGVYADGFKGLLDFRDSHVRPLITHERRTGEGPLDALRAVWRTEVGELVPFEEAIFFAGPFPFVWTRRGPIYRVARDVDRDLVLEIARAPRLLVPAAKLKETGARLFRAARGRGLALPAPEIFGLPSIETPRIALRIRGEPLDLTGELVAIYAKREVSLFPDDGVGSEEGRDLTCEASARARVISAGVVDQDDDGRGERIAAGEERAIAFWQKGLLDLRASSDPPITVELSERLARVHVGAPIRGNVQVVLEGHWLDTRLEFRSDELSVELDAIREALRKKTRYVALSDGRLARISSSIERLADEARAVMDGDSGKLPAHQLGRLERWLDANDGRIDESVLALRKRLRAMAVSAEPEMPAKLDATLRPYQRLGLAWLQFLQALGAGGILADDMGLGKTITTLAFLAQRREKDGPAPTLVVCPTSVASNWVAESARFTPDLRVLLLHGAMRARDRSRIDDSDVVVTTYALLRRDIEELGAIRFRCVVLDEAQNIKNVESATARAANRLDAEMRLALSGTPIENRLRELYSLASFVNPGILGTVRAFETRYERPIAADRNSPLADELRAIVRPFLLRRTKDDVLRELPPKIEMDRIVTLARDEKRMYDALAHALRKSVFKDFDKRQNVTSLSVFAALTRLRQMACDPRLVDRALERARDPFADPLDDDVRPSAKRQAFLELVRELVAEGRRALVFSQFVELLTLWRRDLDADGIAYEYLDGSTVKRDQVVARFQQGAAPLFLISLKAGGAGLNLTAADTVIHCDPWWNPAVEDQATDRAYRIGQDKPVTVVRLVARGTIEEKILSLKAKKRELAKAVIGDDARALEGITDDDIRMLLGDADEAIDDEGDGRDGGALTDVLATAGEVRDPEYLALASDVKWWIVSTGRSVAELAQLVDLPLPYASKLALGEPFPCSRAVANRIRARLRAW